MNNLEASLYGQCVVFGLVNFYCDEYDISVYFKLTSLSDEVVRREDVFMKRECNQNDSKVRK